MWPGQDTRTDLLRAARGLRAYLEWQQETFAQGAPRGNFGIAPAAPVRPRTGRARPAGKASLLAAVREELGDCKRCRLHMGRQSVVFGVGPAGAELMFVGEGPGEDEDIQGEPFVGKAGQLLNRIIAAMGLKRQDVYIANVVKCRPPGNRAPLPDEVETCWPFLKKQIEVIKPKLLVALGGPAAHTLLGNDTPISRLRGRFETLDGIPLMPTFHPAYLLRNPSEKAKVWDDMKKVMGELGLPVAGKEATKR